MNGRVYDPVIGRFLSPDLLIQAPYNSQSFNRYSYVWNNPLSMVDPTGYYCGGPDLMSTMMAQSAMGQVTQMHIGSIMGTMAFIDKPRIDNQDVTKGLPKIEVKYKPPSSDDDESSHDDPFEATKDNQGQCGVNMSCNPVSSPVSSEFRATRTCTNCSTTHPGTDYAAPVGTEVLSTAPGVVDRAYDSRTFGHTVIVKHGPSKNREGNVYTLYAHGTRLSVVDQGQSVRGGQLIMLSGNTGSNTTGPHLHYEVIVTTSTPFQKSFFGNIDQRYAPSQLSDFLQ